VGLHVLVLIASQIPLCLMKIRIHISLVTGRIPQSGKLPVLNLLTGQKSGFSPRRGDSLHRFTSNLSGTTRTWVHSVTATRQMRNQQMTSYSPQKTNHDELVWLRRGDANTTRSDQFITTNCICSGKIDDDVTSSAPDKNIGRSPRRVSVSLNEPIWTKVDVGCKATSSSSSSSSSFICSKHN